MSGAALDVGALASWLQAQGLGEEGAVSVLPLSGGQSNPTFRVDTGRGSLVLRKKPAGALLASAHAIDREYRVMHALRESAVPVPRMIAWCEDVAVIGTPFYLMEFLAGRVLVDQSLPGCAPGERAAIYADMNRVIAALHAVDPDAVGLGDFGRKGQYVARQIARWTRQCEASTLPLPPAMRRLMAWLPQHLPGADETTLVHGDFRLDNLVLDPQQPRVIGVLDWELSTLGDPIADFSYHCMGWRIPATMWRGIGGLDLQSLGIPSEADYLGAYVQSTGRDAGGHWEFYMAYNLFRLAAIVHGIAQRAADGTAAAADAAQTGALAGPLADIGWDCALRHQALHGG